MSALRKVAEPQLALYDIAEVPDWAVLEEVTVDTSNEHDAPEIINLTSQQSLIESDHTATFAQFNVTILDQSRVADHGQILHELEPGTEQIVFHTIRIIRGEQIIDALDPENISTFQRESDLENHISSGKLTVQLIIDDLRAGDTLESTTTIYAVAGDHPVIGKYFLKQTFLSWYLPISRSTVRIINHSDNTVIFRQRDSATELNESELIKPGDEFSKAWDSLPLKEDVSGVPDSFWPTCFFATTQTSWEDLSSDLYDFYVGAGAFNYDDLDVSAIEDVSWKKEDETSLLSIIDFVQNSIRYRGEMAGIHSHTPKSPQRALKKRSGDCKDKSNLLVALLSKIGVEAQLALVSTSINGAIADLDPSPFLMDHMVVRFEFGGNVYFVDPTQTKQGGRLDNRTRLTFEQALIISKGGSGLVEIPKPKSIIQYELRYTFNLKNLEEPSVTISRIFRGARADGMRASIAASQSKDFQEWMLEDIQSFIAAKIEPEVGAKVARDNYEDNSLITLEKYRLLFSEEVIEEGYLEVYSPLHSYLELQNQQPIMQANPVDQGVEHQIRVLYPEHTYVQANKHEIKNAWFTYFDDVHHTDNEMHCKRRLTSTGTIINAEDRKKYQQYVEEVANRFCFTIGLLAKPPNQQAGGGSSGEGEHKIGNPFTDGKALLRMACYILVAVAVVGAAMKYGSTIG